MKAQLFSSDLIAAVFIFLILIVLLSFAYSQALESHSRDLERKTLEAEGMKALENLLRTPGLPENWNSSNAVVIGLSNNNNNILDTNKVSRFFDNISYVSAKNIFGFGGDFEIKFISSGKTKGSAPNSSVENIVFFRRFAYYNGSIENVEMKLWQ